MPDLRRSPLDDRHRQLGAHMTAFGGWEMPLDYGSVVAEHTAVREGSGAFDLSHLGTLRVTGPGAQECIRAAFTNDVTALDVGRAQYTLCLDEGGGIVDDLLVYRLEWGYFVVPNAANAAEVKAALDGVAGAGCEVTDVKAEMACIAVQGPASADTVTQAGVSVADLGYLDCEPLEDGGVLARSGYTGERGYELFVAAEQAPTLWDRVLQGGAEPTGLGARDTLRLEMGYPLHGNDISTATTPVEAGLSWAVKGSGFRGERAYREAEEAGAAHRLRGLRVDGRGIPRAGCTVSVDGEIVGAVTSGTFSPTLRTGIALAYLASAVELGAAADIDVRGKAVRAEVVRPPFVSSDPRS